MAEPSAHINYSFEDIQRYLQGNMSAQEMHDMEKAALQDPFLADAIEGYTEVNPVVAQQHLNEINAALLNKKNETKIVAINRKTQWLRIAAIVIVAAGIGITGKYIFKNSKKEEPIIALQKEVKNTPAIKNAVADSVKFSAPTAANTQSAFVKDRAQHTPTLLSKKESNHSPFVKNNMAEMDTINTITSMNATTQAQEDIIIDSTKVLLKSKVSGLAITDNSFSGKVIDENNKPIPYVAIETLDKQKETITDSAGNFILMEQDSAMHVTASTVGYETKKANLEKNINNKIVLKSAASSLDEVVVVGYDAFKKKAKEEAIPVGGWKNFNKYVFTSLSKDSSGENNYNNNNLVELEFLIDDKGSPYHFKVVKSPDEGKSSKAIDIVKSGPKWTTPSTNKKARVKITF